MSWREQLKGDPIPWLLEPESPGPRYLALRDLLGRAADDHELAEARRLAHTKGPIATILEHMNPEGYWVEPGPGYLPQYTSTVWSLIALAQCDARVEEDERIARACAYVLDQALTPGGQITMTRGAGGTADCVQGNVLWSLLTLGCDDPRLDKAFEWMARSVTGEGVAPMSEKRLRCAITRASAAPRLPAGRTTSSRVPGAG